MAKVDLHIHSSYSDGSDSVKELIKKVLDSGIKVFALTDHDTIAGCSEALKYSNENLQVIPSVELTCEFDRLRCHILGLNCDITNPELNSLIQKGKVLRLNKLETRIKFLKDMWGIELTKSENEWLHTRNSVVKIHVANVLVNRGLASNNIEAMNKYLKGCKTPNSKFDKKEAVSAIAASGGIPIWAHPLGGEGETHISKEIFLNRFEIMKAAGIVGLECYYSRYNADEIEFLVEFANKNGLLISGGSDYHGKNKDVELGKLNTEGHFVDSNQLSVLKKIL